MGISRIVNTDLWIDSEVVDNYTPEDKYFWLYLLTNPQTRQVGVYKLPKKLMAFQMGYSIDSVEILIERFERKYKVIKYSNETQEVAILNYLKYSIVKGGKPVIDCVKKDISLIKDTWLLGEVYKTIKDSKDERQTILEIKEMLSIYDIDNDIDNDNDNDSIVPRIVPRIVEDVPKVTKTDPIPYQEIVNLFNEICTEAPKITKITDKRKKQIALRYKELENIDIFEQAFRMVQESKFLTGDNDRGWVAKFDWLMANDTNIVKVLEGNYKNSKTKSSNPFKDILKEMMEDDEAGNSLHNDNNQDSLPKLLP